VTITGTPVRPQFQLRDTATCRAALGLEPDRATILVMGGSQGASGVNDLFIKTLKFLATGNQPLQFLHLTGPGDVEKVHKGYSEAGLRAVVHSFFAEMELALGAASVAVSRSGASSLAELAAVRVPSVLIPFPAATDNHQFFNAKAFEETGAARLIEQKAATPEILARLITELIENNAVREQMQAALAKWHTPQAAEEIAETILRAIARENEPASAGRQRAPGGCNCGEKHRVKLPAKTVA
jgi:UDP-N-acetylglucosamine--N-acetylmuramyl-(pentapeptide) pyrophosphoryl-undecaprenol N-acetylglucosamine transferase